VSPFSAKLVVNGANQGTVQWPGGIAALVVSGNASAFSLLILNPDNSSVQAFSAATTVSAAGVVSPVYLPAGAYSCTFTGSTTYASLEAVLN
jgi:hypothetical protein